MLRSCGITQNKKECESCWWKTSPGLPRFIARGLREQAYAVDLAADGEQALYLRLSMNRVRSVILDVMLPVQGRLRGLPRTARRAASALRS